MHYHYSSYDNQHLLVISSMILMMSSSLHSVRTACSIISALDNSVKFTVQLSCCNVEQPHSCVHDTNPVDDMTLYVQLHTHTHTRVHIPINTHTRAYTHTHAYSYAHICAYTHTHTYTHDYMTYIHTIGVSWSS